MRKTKIKEVRFTVPIYEAEVSYLVGGDVPQLIQFIKERHKNAKKYSFLKVFKWGKDADSTNAYQFHVGAPLGNGEVFYVWVAENTANLIAHETFHLTGDILYNRGFKYSMKSEEAFAYLNGWLSEQTAKLIKRRARKRVKK